MDEWVGTGMDGGWLCVVLVEERTQREQIINKRKDRKFFFLSGNR